MENVKKSTNYGEVNVVQNQEGQYGVVDNAGNMIVPFGKYGWISGYDHGLARVKSIAGMAVIDLETETVEDARWGMIDMEGHEVLPVEYDEIWNFLGKGRSSTRVVKDGQIYDFYFSSHELRSFVPRSNRSRRDDDEYGRHYGQYAGSYAQDVMGYSDDVIDDAFEGDPDMYWNID